MSLSSAQTYMKTDDGHRVITRENVYRRLNQQVDEVSHGVKSKILQLSGHHSSGTVEEMLQSILVDWEPLPLVALVEYVLNFSSPPGNNHWQLNVIKRIKASTNVAETRNWCTLLLDRRWTDALYSLTRWKHFSV